MSAVFGNLVINTVEQRSHGVLQQWVRIAVLVLAVMAGLPAATVTWDGGGLTDNWSEAANWDGAAPVAGDSLIFANVTRLAPVNDLAANTAFVSISFAATAGDFVLSGNAVTLTGGVAALSSSKVSGSVTIGNLVTFSTAAPTISAAAGGSMVLNGALTNGGLLVTVVAAGPVAIGGAITGTGGLTKTEVGTLTLGGLSATATNNYSGTTTLGQGTIAINGTVALTGGFTFGETAGSTTLSALDLSSGSATFTGLMLAQTNSAAANTISIGNAQTLTLVGGLTLGINSGAATTTKVTVSGAGSMAITGGNVQIGVSQTAVNAANNSVGTLDLAGLTGSFSTTTGVTDFNVGQGNTSGGFLILTNTANTIIATTMNLGHSNGTNGVGTNNQITLGTGTNVIRCDTINIGISKISGTMTFAAQTAGSPGTVSIANKLGSGAANLTLGSNNGTGTAATLTGLLDVRGHVAALAINALQMGIGNNINTGSVTGEIRFDAGTCTIATLTMGSKAGAAGTGTATGTFSIGGGNVTVSTSVTTAINTAATGVGVSNLNLTGGTLTLNGNLTKTGGTNTTSNITVSGGTLNAGGRTIGSAAQTVVFNLQSGALSNLAELNGGGTLTKSTAGTVTLSGTNAWSGATALTAGTLLMGSTNAMPSGTGKGDVTISGTLDLGGFTTVLGGLAGAGSVTSSVAGPCTLTVGSNNASTTFSGVVQNGSGTVAVTKIGTGTQTLSGANTYTGATTISVGSLRVSGSIAAGSAVSVAGILEGTGTVGGNVTVGSGGTIAPGSGGTNIGTLTTGTVTNAANGFYSVNLDGVAPTADLLTATSSMVLAGTLSVASNSNGGGGKVYTIVNAGSLSGTFAGLPNGATVVGGGRAFTVNYTATTVTLTDISSTWDGGGTNDLWSTAANWEGDAVPLAGSHLVFAGSTRLTPVNDLPDNTAFASLNVALGAGNFSISALGSNRLVLTGATALTNAATSGTMTITAPLTFSAAPTITTTAGGTLVLAGLIDNAGFAVTTATAGPLTISGVLSGTGSLIKTGTATMTLSGTAANTHGSTTVTAGVLHLNKTAGVDAIPATLTITGGAVTFAANNQIADTATVTMSGATSVFNGTAANVATLANYTETIAALTVTGGAFNCGTTGSAPLITVSGAASFTGGTGNTVFIGQSGTIFTAGSLSISSMTNTAGGTVGAANTFTLYGTSTTILSTIRTNALTLNGGRINLRRGGAGSLGSRLVLDGDITTATAASFISEDTNGGTTGTIAVQLASIAGAVTRTITTEATLDINVPITNGAATPGGVIKTGSGLLNLGGGAFANTYTGVTTVADGRLHLTKNANTVAVPGNLSITGGQVSLAANNPSNQIVDTAQVTMSGINSVFNGTQGVNQGSANVTETIAGLVATGGNFNAGVSTWTITGPFSMTGGGNTIFVGNSGCRLTVGSLSLTGMTATAGLVVQTNDSFTLYGTLATQSQLTIGAGGLTLNGSVINLRRGQAAGHLGSKLVLNGDITTSGTSPSFISEDLVTTPVGTVAVDLGGIAVATTRTVTTASSANLTIGVAITNGAATPASLVKTGIGALTTTATNTWSGTTTVTQGALYLMGTQATTAVTVDAAGTLGGNGTIPGTIALSGTLAPGSGGTTTGQLSTGATTWNPAAAMVVDLNGSGLVADRLTTTGQTLALDGPLTVTSLINETAGQTFTILSAASITGTFTGMPEGTIIPVGAGGKAVSISYATPGIVTLTVLGRPTVTAITPNNGPTTAQTAVTITGTLFDPAATVTIGGNPATSVVVVNSTTITAVTPTGAQGLTDVVVTNPDTQAGTLIGGYAYTGVPPTLGSLSPSSGPALTATTVTITGTGFIPSTALAVSVGGVAATAVTYVNSTTVTAIFPTMTTTTTDITPDVVITNGDRQQATLANGFTYELRPVDNASGTIAGLGYRYHRVGGPLLPDFTSLIPPLYGVRANATMTGANPFEVRNDNWSVEFGGYITVPTDGIYTLYTASDDGSRLYIGTTLVVSNNFSQGVTERSGQIALSAGRHRLRAEYAQGAGGFGMFLRWQGPTVTKADIPNLAFTCDPAPAIASVTPTSGPQSGGTAVTISGSNFVAGSLVAIDGTLVLSPVVLDENTITVTTPGGTIGAKNVLVIGPRSTGALLTGGFTYVTSAAPTLTAITPVSGPAVGGTTVQLTVSNVDVTPTVTFNGVAATAVVRLNATTVECVTPAMPLTDATADVTVTAVGQSATLADGFTWTLRTPENPSGTQPGLAYGYFKGPTITGLVPDYTTLALTSSSILLTPGFATNPVEASPTTNFSLRYQAYLTVPSDGAYRLYTASDDGSRMYVGSTLVVDNNFSQAVTERSGLIGLAAGTHLIVIEYAQGGGGLGFSVSWSGPGVAKATIPNSAFTCDPAPTVTALDVPNGPQGGGTAVTITGTGFISGATVKFGGTAALSVTVANSTTITCTTPSHALGAVSVVVANPNLLTGTLAGGFTYDPSTAPTITGITPATGPSTGGTAVTITGTGFVAPMAVTFGGATASAITVVNSTTITAVTPTMPGTALAVDVRVTNGASQAATLVGGFTYSLRVPENPTATQSGLTWRYHRVGGNTMPSFTGLTPYAIGVRANATIAQGSPGAANPFDPGFNTNWSVEFDGYLTVPTDGVYSFYTQSDDNSQILFGTTLVLNNTTSNSATVPPGNIGLFAGTHRFTIRLAQGGGTFSLLNIQWKGPGIAKDLIPNSALSTDSYPTITSVTPNAGTTTGGTAIAIAGTGFTSGTTVTVGGTAATSVVVAGDGLSLTAVTPAHALGQVPVMVRNGFGLSVTQANAYLYQGPAPVISAVSPQVGPLVGGTTVLIYGSNFAANPTVRFGGVLATNVSLISGVISARTPAGTQGPVDVMVTNTDAVSGTRLSGFYYQGPAPTITQITPASGPLAGGTAVTITGTNFTTAGVTVTFDGVAATGVSITATSITATTPAGAQGPANVVVTNNDLRTVTAANGFIFEGPAPTLTSISPTDGPVAGGTSVTLTGTNFVAGAVVTFDGVAATGVTVQSGTTIVATTPVGAQGPADVRVTNIDLLAATLTSGYMFLGAPPVISGVNPLAAPNDQPTPITISGSGFAVGVQVTIGGVAATVTTVTSGAITVTMPSGLPPGPAQIVVTNVDLQSIVFDGFIAQGPAPTITQITPARGPLAGGTSVTITGTNFTTGGVTVTFDGVAATSVVITATSITATTPAGAQGPADVVVTNIDQLTASVLNGFIFEGPAPTFTSITPTSGLLAGGTPVTLTGTNFAAGAVVTFDGVAATGVTVQSGTTIVATTPAGIQGPVDVVVTNVDLLAATLTDGYIYLGDSPLITGVNPLAAPSNQASPITISGSGFAVGVQVTIGGVAATVTSVTALEIIVTMPSGVTPGPVPIVVTNVDLQSTVFNGFIAQGDAPILLRIDIPHGPVAGGRLMTLTGSEFRAGAIVMMGGVPATVVTVSANTITAMTPAQAEGAVMVTVTNTDLLTSLPLTYTYYTKDDDRTVGNGCGTGGGLTVFLLLAFMAVGGGFGRRR